MRFLRRATAAENAVGRLLRAAYAIDNFGDLGDWEKIVSAHDEFVAGSKRIEIRLCLDPLAVRSV